MNILLMILKLLLLSGRHETNFLAEFYPVLIHSTGFNQFKKNTYLYRGRSTSSTIEWWDPVRGWTRRGRPSTETSTVLKATTTPASSTLTQQAGCEKKKRRRRKRGSTAHWCNTLGHLEGGKAWPPMIPSLSKENKLKQKEMDTHHPYMSITYIKLGKRKSIGEGTKWKEVCITLKLMYHL